MPSKYVIMLIWDGTNECFKNNQVVRIILHLSMGTKRKYAFGTKVNNPYISYRGWSQKINYIQIYIIYI